MKIGQLLFTRRMTAGVSVFNRSFHSKIEEKGHQVVDFAPYNEDEYAKLTHIGELLKYTTLIEHYDEAKKCDLVFGSNTTSISFIPRKVKLATAFHSVPAGIINEIPSDFERIKEPFVFAQFLKETEKHGLATEINSWKSIENINLADRYIAENCKNIVAVSQRVKAELMNFYNIPSERIQVIENGVQDYWFKNERCPKCKKITDKWKQKKRPILVYLTRISGCTTLNNAVKGIDRAFATIKHSDPNIHKVVISLTSDSVLSRIKKLFASIGAEFIANYPHRHLPHLIREADICIQTSRYEGFGYVLAEEMAAERACVAFSSGFVPEALEDRKNAIIVKNTEEMITAINELAENKELRKKLGKNARKTVLKKYSLGMMADDYIKYFQKIIK